MKVTVWVETEVVADVSVEDFLSELNALPLSERKRSILSAISTVYAVLKNIKSESIQEIDEANRSIISTALREQAERFSAYEKPEAENKLLKEELFKCLENQRLS